MKDSKMKSGQAKWYVLRDLKRPNAKLPAYKLLEEMGKDVFTLKKWQQVERNGKIERIEVPFVPDLLFVHDTKENLDPILGKIKRLQYRYVKGGGYLQPMTVSDMDMERFIKAVNSSENPRFYLPEEISAQKRGKEVSVVGGPLAGYRGRLLAMRAAKMKRLLVELKDFFYVGVEVAPEHIQIIENSQNG